MVNLQNIRQNTTWIKQNIVILQSFRRFFPSLVFCFQNLIGFVPQIFVSHQSHLSKSKLEPAATMVGRTCMYGTAATLYVCGSAESSVHIIFYEVRGYFKQLISIYTFANKPWILCLPKVVDSDMLSSNLILFCISVQFVRYILPALVSNFGNVLFKICIFETMFK